MVQDFTKLTWQNDVANPAVSAPNLQRYEDYLDVLADDARQGPVKRALAATTANITLSGVQTIDGVSLSTGQKCFVKNQTTAANNGVYVVASGAWSRALDADDGTEFTGGTMIAVERGTTNGGKVFRCTNTGAVTINTTALTFTEVGTGTSTGLTYAVDGTTPLKYSAFLTAAGGNETVALQNALNALAAPSVAEYAKYLDLEGRQINLTSMVTMAAAQSDNVISVYNGEIKAVAGFTGSHLISGAGSGSLQCRWQNVTFSGNDIAGWCVWTNGNMLFHGCHFYNNVPAGNTAGLRATDTATFYIRHCRFLAGDGSLLPSARSRIAVWAEGDEAGDQKISSSVFAHFKHAIIYDAFVLLMTDCHIFQGTQGASTTPTYTAGIKFTRATFGSSIVNLYLDKCYIELSNETKPGGGGIGGIDIIGVKTLSVVDDAGFCYILARDYHSQTNMVLSNITIIGCQFSQNTGQPQIKPTGLYNPGSFNRQGFDGIYMAGNTFTNVQPQANPCTLKKNFGSQTNHMMTFGGGYLPFASYPMEVIAFTGDPSSGGDAVLRTGTSGNVNDVNIESGAAWAGDLVVTATCNSPRGADGSGFRFVG